MNATNLPRTAKAVFGLMALALLAGCADFPSWAGRAKVPTDAQVAAVLARTAEPIAMEQTVPEPPTTLLAATSR